MSWNLRGTNATEVGPQIRCHSLSSVYSEFNHGGDILRT